MPSLIAKFAATTTEAIMVAYVVCVIYPTKEVGVSYSARQ